MPSGARRRGRSPTVGERRRSITRSRRGRLSGAAHLPGLARASWLHRRRLVLTESEAVVIEVNPRLTTAYLGVRSALEERRSRRKRRGTGARRLCRHSPAPPPVRRSVRFTPRAVSVRSYRFPMRRLTGSKSMKGPILGWDVGGANIKAARIEEDGRSEPTVLERPFPLWREPRPPARGPGGGGRTPWGRAHHGGHHDRRAGRLLRHQAGRRGLRARRLPHGVPRRRAVGLRRRRTIPIGRGGAAATASRSRPPTGWRARRSWRARFPTRSSSTSAARRPT